MTQGTNPTHPMTLKIDDRIFQEIARLQGWNTNADIARGIGVSPKQVKRILTGKQEPTARFIAGLLHNTPLAGFRRTFEIVPATNTNEEVTTT